jgi:site-specific recombinase XerD
MKISAAIDRCLRRAKNIRAQTTARSYGTALRAFKEYIEAEGMDPEDDIDQLNMDTFIFYQSWLSVQGYSKQTIGVYIYGVRYFLEWLVIEGHILPNYQEMLRYNSSINEIQKKKEYILPRWPKSEDVERMLKAARDRNGIDSPVYERDIAIIESLASSGCRVSELAGLTIKDMDLEDKSAIVMGKGKRQRRAYFNGRTINALINYWKVRGNRSPNSPFFMRHDRAAVAKEDKTLSVRSIQNVVDNVAMIAGIERGNFSPHYFRHAFAIKALRETGNLALVQDLMGHQTPQATRIYAKIYPDDLRDAYRNIFDDE